MREEPTVPADPWGALAEAASGLFLTYNALTTAGFTPAQAMQLLVQMLSAGMAQASA